MEGGLTAMAKGQEATCQRIYGEKDDGATR